MRNYWSAPLKADNRGSHYFLHSRPVRDSLCGLDINTWAFMALLRLQDKKNQKFQLLLIQLVPGLGPLTCQGPVRAHRLPGLWAGPEEEEPNEDHFHRDDARSDSRLFVSRDDELCMN
jgi:hypothetical protein